MLNNNKYYDILGISPTADAGQIKKAYIKKSKEYHPDKNKAKEAEDIFKDISRAYHVLSDDVYYDFEPIYEDDYLDKYAEQHMVDPSEVQIIRSNAHKYLHNLLFTSEQFDIFCQHWTKYVGKCPFVGKFFFYPIINDCSIDIFDVLDWKCQYKIPSFDQVHGKSFSDQLLKYWNCRKNCNQISNLVLVSTYNIENIIIKSKTPNKLYKDLYHIYYINDDVTYKYEFDIIFILF